jgi:hypothetical protein
MHIEIGNNLSALIMVVFVFGFLGFYVYRLTK